MERLYAIAPLEWDEDEDGDFRADTPFGSYTVSRYEHDGWYWGYCFDEYHDEDNFSCEGADEGKRLAEANWLERISGAIEPRAPRPDLEEENRELRKVYQAGFKVRGGNNWQFFDALEKFQQWERERLSKLKDLK